jgi:hypothetical protein
MKKGKRRVRRLALYLRSIGVQPNAAGTESQYDQLEQEQRKLARKTGRQLLIEFGFDREGDCGAHQPCCSRDAGRRLSAGRPSQPIQ